MKKPFEFILIIGISGELLCLASSLMASSELNNDAANARKDSAEAIKQAAEANERASSNELARAALEEKIQQIESKTPGRTRVLSAQAIAYISFGTNAVFRTNRMEPGHWSAELLFSGTNGSTLMPTPFVDMVSDDVMAYGPNPLHFKLFPVSEGFERPFFDKPADELLNELQCFSIQPYFLHDNVDILGGKVTLVLNSSVSKTFLIPPQTLFWHELRTNATTGQLEEHPDINCNGTGTRVEAVHPR